MKCPECGCDRWVAHQIQRWTVIVNEDNEWQDDVDSYDSEAPYGPYQCERCGHEVDSIDEG